jgi:predicted acetyltransferase
MSGGRSVLTLDVARPDEAPVLANLLELYSHELSDVFGLEIGADGRFGYARLPLYFAEPGRFPFLVRLDGRLAGFALATVGSPASDDPGAIDVAEFFVLRRHRKTGVGGRAAVRLWNGFPGRTWTVRVSTANASAMSFWTGAVGACARDGFREGTLAGKPYPRRVLTFRSRTSP